MNLRKRLHFGKLTTPSRESGQGLVEYSILLMLIAIVIFAALQGLGATLEMEYYEPLCNAVENAGR